LDTFCKGRLGMAMQLQQTDIKKIIIQLAETFNREKDFLNDLDSKIGDGDHGLSMSRGFNAVRETVEKNPDLTISDLLIKGGMQFNEVTGSTIGFLIFSAMRAAGLVVKDKETINLKDLQNMLQASIEAIKKRGKASKGQKTILDSLIPALEYLEEQNAQVKESLVIKEMVKKALEGAESTKKMESQIGRAKWFSDRSVGVMDPGAYTGYLILNTIGEYTTKKNQFE
jgi:dihydroxyacetone kinase-like protein